PGAVRTTGTRARDARGASGDERLIVSEYPPCVEPAPWRFPARKRRRLAAKPFPLNQAVRQRRTCGEMRCRCGPGVVLPGRPSLATGREWLSGAQRLTRSNCRRPGGVKVEPKPREGIVSFKHVIPTVSLLLKFDRRAQFRLVRETRGQ